MAKNASTTKTRAKRQPFGELSELPSGRWRARYVGPDGCRHTPGRSFPDEQLAQEWLSGERRLIDLSAWDAPAERRARAKAEKITVAQWIDTYLNARESEVRESTMATYRRTVENRITAVKDRDVAKLAAMPLVEVKAKDAYSWWDAMVAAFPETRTTNRRAHVVLRAAFAAAIERELISTNPVAVKAAKAKPRTKEKQLPTAEELRAIVNHLPQAYRLAGALCLLHGLRVGEMLALRRENVKVTGKGEEMRAVVQVRANLQRLQDSNGHCAMVRQPPKSAAGRRDVPVLAEFVPLVVAHLDRMDDKAPGALVTSTRTGAPVMDTSFRSVFNRARKAAGVREGITPHYGRNWLITRLAELGATPKEIGAILGQEDLSTILNIYMKVRAERPADLMARLSA